MTGHRTFARRGNPRLLNISHTCERVLASILWAELISSGQRQSFGKDMAIRDTADDKLRPDLISPFAEERQGHWLRMGAAKYAERNWEKGMPFSRCVASLKRHLMKYQQGLRDEDHLAAIMFNAMALIHYEEMIERGLLPAELNDMPCYEAVVKMDMSVLQVVSLFLHGASTAAPALATAAACSPVPVWRGRAAPCLYYAC